jgi:hypothetical protein
VLLLAGCGASTLPRVEPGTSTVDVARAMIDKHDYIAASELLKSYVERNAGSGQVDDAIFLLGESHLLARGTPRRRSSSSACCVTTPSDSSAAAAFRLGESLAGQSRMEDFDQEFTVKALEQYQRTCGLPGGLAQRRSGEADCPAADPPRAQAPQYSQPVHEAQQADAGRVYYSRVRDEYADTALLGDAIIGIAQCDAIDGHRDEAIASLRELEEKFHGQALGQRATYERKRIEHMPANYHLPKKVHTVPLPPPTGQPSQGPQ